MKNLSGAANELPPLSKRKLVAMSPKEIGRFLDGVAYVHTGRPYHNRMNLLNDFINAKAEAGVLGDFNKTDIEDTISLFEYFNRRGLSPWLHYSSNEDKEAIRANQRFAYNATFHWIDQQNQISPDTFKFIQQMDNSLFRHDLFSRCFEKNGYSVENLESFLSFLGDEKIVTNQSGRPLGDSLTITLNSDDSSNLQFLGRWLYKLQNINFQFLEERVLPHVNTEADRVPVITSFLRSRETNFSFDDLERHIFPVLLGDDEYVNHPIKKVVTLSWLENRSVSKDEFIKACRYLGMQDVENNIDEAWVHLGIKKESLIVSKDKVRVNISNNIVSEEEIKIESEDVESLCDPTLIFEARQLGEGVAKSLVKWLDSYPKDVNEELFLQVIDLAEGDSEKLEIICSWPFSRLSNEKVSKLSDLFSDEKAKSQLLRYFVAFNQGECSYEQVTSLLKEDRSLARRWIDNIDYKLNYEELVKMSEYLDVQDIYPWFRRNNLDEGDINEAIGKVKFFYKNRNDSEMAWSLGCMIKNRSEKTIEDVSLVLEQCNDVEGKQHIIMSLAKNPANLEVRDIVALYQSLQVTNDNLSRLEIVNDLLSCDRVTGDEFESYILPLIPNRTSDADHDSLRRGIINKWLERCKDQDEQLKLRYLELFATCDVVGPEKIGRYYSELSLNEDDLITNCEGFYPNNADYQAKMLLAAINADNKDGKEVGEKIIKGLITKSKRGDVILKVLSQSCGMFNERDIFDIVSNAALAGIDLGHDYKNLSKILNGKTLADVLSPENWKTFNEQLDSRALINQDAPFALVLLSMKLAGDNSLEKLTKFLDTELRLEISSVFITGNKPYLNDSELPHSLGITNEDMVSVQKLADSIRPKIKPVPEFNKKGFDPQTRNLAGDLFTKETEEINEDEVAEFFEKLFHLESKISKEASGNYGSERSKLQKVFQAKRREIAYILQQEDGPVAVGTALYSIGDGCVANFGTYLNKTINRFLIEDKNTVKLYAFFESFAAEMLNSVGVDTLGGSRTGLDILNNRFNDRFYILPNVFLEKLSQSYSSEDGIEILKSIKGAEYADELRSYIEDQEPKDYELPNRIASLLIVQQHCPEITNHAFAKNFLDGCKNAMNHCEEFVAETASIVDQQQSCCLPSTRIFSRFVQELFGNNKSTGRGDS